MEIGSQELIRQERTAKALQGAAGLSSFRMWHVKSAI